MQIGVFNPVLYSMGIEDSLKYLNSLGVTSMELGCGGYPGTKHADAKRLVKNPEEAAKLKELFKRYNIKISALSAHGNPVHPDGAKAKAFHEDFIAACRLANLLGVDRVVTFSGCPGDGKGDKPNWVTCAWPLEYGEVLNYQWNDVLIPYWKKTAEIAAENNVKHICFEMHPGFCVYNPETLLKLRNAVGDIICANFDPSHLIWQGIDPVAAIRYLGKDIKHFHAKDTGLYSENIKINGVLDTKPFTQELKRSWLFRTVGYGSCEALWKNIISALKMTGYDYVLSIEHEDSVMSPKEGLEKAVSFLKDITIYEKNESESWWA